MKRFAKDMVSILLVSLKNNFCEIKLKSESFQASSLSTYNPSAIYTILPHNLFIEGGNTFSQEGPLFGACNEKTVLFY